LLWNADEQLLHANLPFDLTWLMNVKFEVEKTVTSTDKGIEEGIEREQLVA
jgi:hypothetical protein